MIVNNQAVKGRWPWNQPHECGFCGTRYHLEPGDDMTLLTTDRLRRARNTDASAVYAAAVYCPTCGLKNAHTRPRA